MVANPEDRFSRDVAHSREVVHLATSYLQSLSGRGSQKTLTPKIRSGSEWGTGFTFVLRNQQNDCAPSEDSDQPGHPPSLFRVFAVRSMGR